MAEALQDCLLQDLQLLHNDRDSADLEFVTGGNASGKVERIRAHRLIVLFRCRRYRNKKQSWLAANTPMVTVQLEYTEPETAKRIVRYLYTGQVSCAAPLCSWLVAYALEGMPLKRPNKHNVTIYSKHNIKSLLHIDIRGYVGTLHSCLIMHIHVFTNTTG